MKRPYLLLVIIFLGLVSCSREPPKKHKIETYKALIQQIEQVKKECEDETLNSIVYSECLEKLAVVKHYTVKLILEEKVSKDDYSVVIASVDSAIVELAIIKNNMQRKRKDNALLVE